MERVLLLSLGFGTGHNAAAHTLQQEFQNHPNVKVEMIDLLDLIPNTVHPLLQSGYHGMLAKFPSIYHWLYDWTYQSRIIRYVSTEILEKVALTIRKKINDRLERINPTRIVTTHPFALLMLPSYWEKIPSVGVLTDYEIHPIWLARVPDTLCVPKKLLQRDRFELFRQKSGVNLVETGLPIDPKYYERVTKEEACAKLSLSTEKPVVLIMGGGMGLGPMEQLVKQSLLYRNYQVIVLCGKNESLYNTLRPLAGKNLQVLSFRQDVDYWMSAADLLITKPGGVTVTEAISKYLPMFLFKAFPGQEEANQRYLVKHRVAVISHLPTIGLQMKSFFALPEERRKQKKHFTPLMAPDAAREIVQEALKGTVSRQYIMT